MLSRLVITFLPRNKHLLISWLQSLSVVILEPRKIKSDTVSTVSPFISHEVMGNENVRNTERDVFLFEFEILHFNIKFTKVKVESEKVGLKLNIQKTKIMASGPITSCI